MAKNKKIVAEVNPRELDGEYSLQRLGRRFGPQTRSVGVFWPFAFRGPTFARFMSKMWLSGFSGVVIRPRVRGTVKKAAEEVRSSGFWYRTGLGTGEHPS